MAGEALFVDCALWRTANLGWWRHRALWVVRRCAIADAHGRAGVHVVVAHGCVVRCRVMARPHAVRAQSFGVSCVAGAEGGVVKRQKSRGD
eukprot:2959944-Prymnesium_polylepis.1